MSPVRLAAFAALLAFPPPGAALVLGGGFADTDCTIAFSGVDADAGASGVVCTDGDRACDGDGTADGTCRFAVALCARVAVDGCGIRDVDAVRVAGLALAEPPLGVDGACGAPADVAVPAGGAAGATVLARQAGELRDVDYLNLCCVAAPGTLDAARCAVVVDPSAAGCPRIPAAVRRPFLKARRLVSRLAGGGNSPRLLRNARRALGRARTAAQRFAEREACGNALGLMARHGLDVLPVE